MTAHLQPPREPLTWRSKGLLPPGRELDDSDVIGTSIFDGPFTWPLLTLRESALRHNVAQLAAFCAERGVVLAPHAKTTMSPQLVQLQLAAGAWAITVATAHQAFAARAWGASRILLANELVDVRALRRIVAECDADPDFEFSCYVDSLQGVAAIAEAAGGRPFRVLVELGRPGARTGCRDIDSVVAVAQAAVAAGLDVAGVAGYEGGLPDGVSVREYVGLLRDAAARLHNSGLLPGNRPCVVTAGGSSWFDVVADALTEDRCEPFELLPVLRSGAYVGHDEGFYQGATPYAVRLAGQGELLPAMRLWAQVLSVPEPGLAFAGFGKRDASFDLGLPTAVVVRGAAGAIRPASGIVVTKLDDQHAYLDVRGPALAVGDLVGFGLSHPCTVFDKWSTICVVDDDERVTGVVRTYF